MGNTVLAVKNVTMNEPFFMGHFPHKPLMPGVLQIEAMAQAGALACLLGEKKPQNDFVLAQVQKGKFKNVVQPGDVLKIHAEVTRFLQGMVQIKASCEVNDQCVSQCELLAGFLKK